MADTPFRKAIAPVPSGRIGRLGRMGGLAAGIAGSMLSNGARQIVKGQRPRLNDLILTPANATRITEELSRMRGAAMKIGQLVSMDAGEVLPPALAQIMSRLRDDAAHMPPQQLRKVLETGWGKDWLSRFARFETRPLAAASIGQVHRGLTKDGRDIAIKVQYPGVRASIDSDVANVGTLLRLSGLLPKSLDIATLLEEARVQLHDEADYIKEAQALMRFGDLLADDDAFELPAVHADLSNRDILVMDFIDSQPIEALETAPQSQRDAVMTALVRLVLDELFTHRLMQTDPNFANYRFNPRHGRVVLLDFGATRTISPDVSDRFRDLMRAGLSGDPGEMRAACIAIGYFDEAAAAHHQQAILGMFDLAMQPLRQPGIFDFGASDMVRELRDRGMAMGAEGDFWHIPPAEVLFLHRKFGGLYLLGARLKARIDVHGLLDLHR